MGMGAAAHQGGQTAIPTTCFLPKIPPMRPPFQRALPLALLAILGPALAIPPERIAAHDDARPTPERIAQARDPALLVLAAGIFDPRRGQLEHPLVAGRRGAGGSRYAIVQLEADAPLDAGPLTRRGLRVLAFVPNRAFLVEAPAQARAGLAADPAVRFVGDWRADYKIAGNVLDGDEAQIELDVLLPRDADRVEAVAAIHAAGLALLHDGASGEQPLLRVRVPRERAAEAVAVLALLDTVQWIERHRLPEPMNHNAVGPIQGNAPSGGMPPTVSPIWNRGILGSGQIVAVADSGLDRNEGWFNRYHNGLGLNTQITDASATTPPMPGPVYPARKVFGYFVMPGATAYDNSQRCTPSSPLVNFHGTHVAGSVAGDAGTASTPVAANYEAGGGMAPNAQILFQDIGHDTTGCLSGQGGMPMWQQASAVGAKISSNSYGSQYSGAYSASDAALDQTLWRDESMLIVVAAGNAGSGASTIGHPAHAKHALTVGALGSGDSGSVASFSSRGPASDGRRKPDIMAPGVGIVSASGNTNNANPPANPDQAFTKSMQGTSMATPIVSGAAALVRQYFEDGFYPTGASHAPDARSPLGSELKAVLLNGTAFVAGEPSHSHGWGRAWLDSNLYFPGDARRLRTFARPQRSGIATGEVHHYQVAVAGGAEFRATLTWYDPPAAPGLAGVALVNDLDLEVVAGANTYLGNVIAGSGPAASSIPGGSADAVNPVEQVRFTAPAAGTYTIRVRGTQVPGDGQPFSDRQGYALAVSAAGCPTAVGAAPASISAAMSGDDVAVTPSAVSNATGYQLYRADGTCASADPRDFQFVAHASGTSLIDAHTQGGYAYAYKARAVDACGEGPIGACADIVSSATCSLSPEFDAYSVTVNAHHPGLCSARLHWAPGTSLCPTAPAVRYNVYRSTDPLFDPTPATLIAQGVGGTQYVDRDVLPLTTYHYIVRAEDGTATGSGPSGGNESNGIHRVKFTPSAGSVAGTFADGADSPSFMTLQAPWSITPAHAASGSYSYRNAPHGAATYAADTCAAITTPPLALGGGATLSFAARYDIEPNWDGVVMEISTDGGTTWIDLPPDGGYPSSFASTGNPPINACGYPASRGAFGGTTGGGFVARTRSLAAFAGQTAQIRWRMSTDPGDQREGFHLDAVQVTNASTPGACVVDAGFLFEDGFE